jgi:hypothetical protein
MRLRSMINRKTLAFYNANYAVAADNDYSKEIVMYHKQLMV